MTTKKIFLALVFLVLLTQLVSADFVGSSTQSAIDVCSCATAEDTIYVKNTGSTIAYYMLSNNLDWVTQYPSSFIINPGETQSVKSFVSPSCSFTGDTTLVTEIVADTTKTLRQKISVNKCNNLNLQIIEQSKESCPCQPLIYKFSVQNTGTFLETYSFSVDKLSEYVTFSENPVLLNHGESKEIFVYVNTPCDLYGIFDIALNVKATGSGFSGKANLDLKLNPCYGFDIITQDAAACELGETIIPVELHNTANIMNTYSLSLEGPDWISLPGNAAILAPAQAIILNLTANPPKDAIATYNVTFVALTEKGSLEGRKSFLVDVENCYDFEISLKDKDTVACGTNKYDFEISNKAKYPQVYNLTSNALIKNSVSVNPGQTARETLSVFSSCENISDVFVAVNAINNFGVEKTKTLALAVLSKDKFYKIKLLPKSIRVSYDDTNTQISITNLGKTNTEYTVYAETIDLARIPTSVVELDVGETKTINVTFYPSNVAEGTYLLNVFVKVDDFIQQNTVKFVLKDSLSNKIKNAFTSYKNKVVSL